MYLFALRKKILMAAEGTWLENSRDSDAIIIHVLVSDMR